MRNCWLFSVSVIACVIGGGFAHAQPPRSGIPLAGDPRAAVPSDLKAPTNRLPERAGLRGLATADDARATLPVVVDIKQLARGGTERSYHARTYREQSREMALVTTPTGRDRSLFVLKAGDKVNKIPDFAVNRYLTSEASNRAQPPALLQPAPRGLNGLATDAHRAGR